ncbi:hypothetical protein BK128_09270 [Viridibacillus sp. FSL H7-0596]|uniref:helix-turn-helix domain-containing protein n=1 Tax=Viridibacillus sp. FSL H7-0596 TaxID=1928923 RepID=UPI00096E8633|nr:helix-turn-helix transcriptional regulator [Viridibacillus sp. FSL H7-0596]OMC86850.1 hypothetical protein BK128_09270 [Viridibacillus sp. FSL H7-0596]
MQFNYYKLKAARNLKGYSIEEMARRIGIDVHAYWRIESDKTQLKVHHLLKIATVLEQPISYFVEENEPITDVVNRVTELRVLLERLDDEGKIQYSGLLQSLEVVCST